MAFQTLTWQGLATDQQDVLRMLAKYHGAVGTQVMERELDMDRIRLLDALAGCHVRGLARSITAAGFWQVTEDGRKLVPAA